MVVRLESPSFSCTFKQNEGGYGGAVSGGNIINCVITENAATNQGGGVWVSNGYVGNCTIEGNTAPNGGGIFGSCSIWDCLIANNHATQAGGGLWAYGAIGNCTITGNTAEQYGGGINCGGGDSTLWNCLLWGNSCTQGAQVAIDPPNLGTLTVKYCDSQGGQAAVYHPYGTLIWGDGNINADPLFSDADGPDDDPATWLDNDYHISSDNSPCFDAGDPNYGPYPDDTDIDGQDRMNGCVDIGADEFYN